MARPIKFDEFHGQSSAVSHLKVALKAAIRMKKPLGHVLLSGPPGLGKTTLGAYVIPAELGVEKRIVNCASVEKPADLFPTLSTMKAGEVLFLDEIHALPPQLKEVLYTVMEDFTLPVVIGEEGRKQILNAELPPFTIVGATTREGLLPIPMLDRFKHQLKLDLYEPAEMKRVLFWTAQSLGAVLTPEACDELVLPCHGTARHAGRLIEACIQTVVAADDEVLGSSIEISPSQARETLKRLKYARGGLTQQEVRILRHLAEAPQETLGLSTLASVLDEEAVTVEDVYEPWLLRQGYVIKTSRGRVLTPTGRRALQETT